VKRCEQAIVKHKRNGQAMNISVQKAEELVETLNAEFDKSNPDEGKLGAYQDSLRESEGELVIVQDTYGNTQVALEEQNATATARKRELEAVKIRLAEHETKLRKAREKVRNADQLRKIALQEKNHSLELIEEVKAQAEHAERKRDSEREREAHFVEEASKVCPRVSIPAGEDSASLDKKYEEMRKRIKEFEKAQGGTDKEIHDAAAKAEKAYKRTKDQRRELEELHDLLSHSFHKRMEMYRRFQRYISCRSRINFQYLLSERAFRGKLNIDHVAKQLEVHVEPDINTRSGKGRKTKTLSGGEKSFSSICLLLSLWEAMGAPLRCLDEYDVFMDDVNRDVSTKMIVSSI
jgi:chromosome segregation ATPase